MWIQFNDSFFSIVEDTTSHNERLLVRARRSGDIEVLLESGVVVGPRVAIDRTPERDYLFRVSMPKADVADLIAARIKTISYPNFKASLKDGRLLDPYYGAYHELAKADDRQA